MRTGQILLNNLLYDTGQLAIPGDSVDTEQLRAPSHWNIAFIRRFMFLFGPISSIFDFPTFALMLFVFDALPGEFRAGRFIESIATQTLIILAIRTRRVPFLRSRPSGGLLIASLGVVALGIFLPLSPLAGMLGFDPLPVPFFLAPLGMIVVYLILVKALRPGSSPGTRRRCPPGRSASAVAMPHTTSPAVPPASARRSKYPGRALPSGLTWPVKGTTRGTADTRLIVGQRVLFIFPRDMWPRTGPCPARTLAPLQEILTSG